MVSKAKVSRFAMVVPVGKVNDKISSQEQEGTTFSALGTTTQSMKRPRFGLTECKMRVFVFINL
ncbi:hypothetical protein M8C21_012255 [Ambrosia artemisiifolia]|uniref:Uncharacterized protein n=1 Tax=Ambrosia artemisiifolia TaxID=4212 RepID=A0AAD5DAL6_AMBAR|nr:hypothetical protein M8C21_012255 [Ambrosia artemisiifolia]